MNSTFAAGAATISIQQLYEAAFARTGRCFATPQHPQKLRCLVFAQGGALTVILNVDWGFWIKPFTETHQVIAKLSPDGPVQVFSFAAHVNGNIDLDVVMVGAFDEQDKYFDARLRDEFLDAVAQVFMAAKAALQPVVLAIGRGTCSSVTMNSFRPDEPVDPTVHVLRVADAQGQLIAAVVNFGCRSDDVEQELSAGIAGAVEATVQQVYGPVPVLHMNAAEDFYKAMRHVPPYQNGTGKAEAKQTRPKTLSHELDRIGRVLGGEVCKVLAELEVAGDWLEAQNQRHLATAWIKRAPGARISAPTLVTRTVPLALTYEPAPAVEVCAVRLQEIEAAIKPLQKKIAFEPTGNVPLPIDSSDPASDAYRWMELVAARKLWRANMGGAKQTYQLNRKKWTWQDDVCIIALGHDLAVIGLPAIVYQRTIDALQQASPFTFTPVWSTMAPLGLQSMLPPQERALGGPHSYAAYAESELDRMVETIATALRDIYDTIGDAP